MIPGGCGPEGCGLGGGVYLIPGVGVWSGGVPGQVPPCG